MQPGNSAVNWAVDRRSRVQAYFSRLQSKLDLQSSRLVNPRGEVNDLRLLDQSTETAHEVLVHRILPDIVVSVFCIGELNDKSMRDAILNLVYMLH